MIAAGRESVCFHGVTYGRPHSLTLDGHYKLDSVRIKKKKETTEMREELGE